MTRSPVDGGVVVASLLLLGLGVVMSYSATAPLSLETSIPPLFAKHVGAAAVGIALAFAVMWVPVSTWRLLALPLWVGSVVLLVVTAWHGVEVNGSQRWLAVPALGVRFQPAEIAKLATLTAVAACVAGSDGRSALPRRRALLAVGLAAVPAALLLVQPDFGGAVVLCGLVWLVLLAAGLPLRTWIVPVLAAPFVVWLYAWTHPYAWRRLVAFLDPWAVRSNEGFQLVQSFLAFEQGGLTGVGLGNGRQKLFYLPEAHTDFILALVGEELGLVGVLVVLGAFAALWIAGIRVARRARDRFPLLLAFAMTCLLTVPAMLNAAVVMGLVPTKGLTLPFLSYGRTSLVMSCVAVGVILAVARQTTPDDARSADERVKRRSTPWR